MLPAELKAVIFGTSGVVKSTILAQAACRLAQRLRGFRVVAICETGPQTRSHWVRGSVLLVKTALAKLFNRADPVFLKREMLEDIHTVARRHRIEVLTPRDRNINHPEFVAHLRDVLRPNLALAFGCAQVFKPELIGVFEIAVNNHDGILPDYRGWCTTEWSIYHGESHTGFTYHYLTEEIDNGPILCSGSVPVGDRPVQQLLYEKAKRAAAQLEAVLRAVASGGSGTLPTGESRYFSRRDLESIISIERPETLDWEELQRRLRAFGRLRITLDGEPHVVTKLERCGSGAKRHHTFVTADGVRVAATRFRHLPFWLYNIENAHSCLPARW